MPLTPEQPLLNDKYRTIKLIGEGAFARVWLADEPAAGRQVAIKEIKRETLSSQEAREVEDRFAREMRIGGKLFEAEVPNVVRAITTEKLDGDTLLVMEYLPGGSLADRLKDGPLPVDEAVGITLQLLEALAPVHGRFGMVHRDIKPSNVLFTADRRAKLADFGLAQTTESGRSLGAGRAHPGTPGYMCPEQVRETGYLLPSCDLYALGCVLFEMLTGRKYQDCRPGTTASNLQSEVSAWLDDVLTKALAVDPWSRYESANDMTDALVKRDRKQTDVILRQWQPEPRSVMHEDYAVGQLVEGTITCLTNFGAFARVGSGIEGLIHISELAYHHVKHPREVVKKGDVVTLRIIGIQPRRPMLLSLKQALHEK